MSLLVVVCSCDETPVQTGDIFVEDSLVVHAILDPDQDRQKVVISRVLPPEDFQEIYVNDVQVKINNFPLEHREVESNLLHRRGFNYQEDYNYYTRLEVENENTYTLVVTRNRDTLITGQTTVPEIQSMEFSPPNRTFQWVAPDAPLFYFSASSNRGIYEENRTILHDRTPMLNRNDLVSGRYTIPADQYSEISNFRFAVTAVDSNYFEYIINESTRAGISGGRGVFGSQSREEYIYTQRGPRSR